MTARRALVVLVVCAGASVLQLLLVRTTAESHAAHAVLAAGHALPPAGPLLLAAALLAVRIFVLVIVPGLVLAALTSLAARVLVGEKHVRQSAGSSDGAGISVGTGVGTTIGGRGTK